MWFARVDRSQYQPGRAVRNCASLASRTGLYAGAYWIVAGLVVVVLIIYFSLWLINR